MLAYSETLTLSENAVMEEPRSCSANLEQTSGPNISMILPCFKPDRSHDINSDTETQAQERRKEGAAKFDIRIDGITIAVEPRDANVE